MRDKIILEGMCFYGYHGVDSTEREKGQRFEVDVEAYCDLISSARSDKLQDTIDYVELFSTVKSVVEGPPHKLLETLAETLAASILDEFLVTAVRIRVRKPDVPIPNASIRSAGVELHRNRN